MGRLRRRKRKYTWFPQIGTQGEDDENDSILIDIQIAGISGNGDPSDPVIFPIIPDTPLEIPSGTTGVGEQLSEFIANEYFLKRIVGKFSIALPAQINTDPTIWQALTFGAGFFIARDGGTSNITGPPIGAASAAERKRNYGPLNLQTTREPWIWRRTWTMSPDIATAAGGKVYGPQYGSYPPHNYHGSVAEGSMIDARTARRVTADDRLYFALQGQTNSATGASGSSFTTVNAVLDVRILGALRRARNRSAF